ncbi:aldehyde dehydrogenase [Aspergillus sclerotioniger CBS 115572]|uniref:Aldehyde dehydrogenase n=1 Tax=Aspergillus sclerotioniger CBS 115572 TaxID=1450535 RepID=A0A317XCD0_9EURO|nr:aldehyde dehydrogenase [Aspergillus sclerotioniger CBS 115572]PWY95995.1 aldehyde dehydrogenase [Aspergillus sclerotioniger CBS 115572]
MESKITPLIIDNREILHPSGDRVESTPSSFQGATNDLAIQAVESCASAFSNWSTTSPAERRALLNKAADILESRSEEFIGCMQEEVHAPRVFAEFNVRTGVDFLREYAALTTDALAGSIPVSQGDSYALVFKEPLGVILAIAPWNAPILLGLRSIAAPLAAGNTVIFKGSELSPRTHFLVSTLFKDAGFPPGVVNFILHRAEDAAFIYETMINHRAVRKCNFTGSTNVGRIIASKAALALKPVLLELGGKNFALVLEDADIAKAAEEIVRGSTLNNGQICMSTDLVLAVDAIHDSLVSHIFALLRKSISPHRVITPSSNQKLTGLINDARAKGATIHTANLDSGSCKNETDCHATVIEGLTQEMDFFTIESFGPVVGIVRVKDENQAMDLIQQSTYGLSAAIFTTSHFRALQLARRIRVGAVHVNSMTVHDEVTLPHGGHGDSGWGRFGAKWGVEEFLQTRTVVLNP